ncbi:DUF1793-domain-containing protein [Aureobasidium subglaciale]|nr:DUF1793-domain-containing protein [Aureobasidium subglaciale]KAI5216640.1 DUF1793-domain-containing protein [Aureobasidium subglaciale]KAI5219994.1 DUF1793-domain-containing protein [Aureobasidium subglaciale]KAI5257773.1 DUF1793-domain-containing protein [Aureobasidium subglaciale]
MITTLLSLLLVSTAWAQEQNTQDYDSNRHKIPTYSPVRPPAVPLAVRSPYTSIWISTANNGTLNTNEAMFWQGTTAGWEGIIVIDGIIYEYLGTGLQSLPPLANVKTASQLAVSFDSQYSNFTIRAGPVDLVASFLSPVIPRDLCRTSIPLSYLQVSFYSTDGQLHDVQLYSDVNAGWISPETNTTLNWNLFEGNSAVNGSGNATSSPSTVYSWVLSQKNQYDFGEQQDFPQWGNFTYSSSPGQSENFSFQSGHSLDLRYNYVKRLQLSNVLDSDYRGAQSKEPVFAFAHDFGSTVSGSALYTIGTVQQNVIRFLTSDGLVPLQPWWTECYGDDLFDLINFHYDDFATSQAKGAKFEAQLKADVQAYYSSFPGSLYSNSTPSTLPSYVNSSGSEDGTDQFGHTYILDSSNVYGFLDPTDFNGIAIPDVSEAESYYAIVALSARQVMAAYVLTVPPTLRYSNSSSITSGEPLLFQKEISSNGNMNTVDVIFPALPFYLYANPQMLKFVLNPLFHHQENGFYPNGYSMHDLGTHFPNATGHVEGNDEYMPVEESGNMLLKAYSYYKFTGNTSFLIQHYSKYRQWASYVIQYSLVPEAQLSTDDFAGTLANQTNLAIKGILGLKAMSFISQVVGDLSAAANYSATASSYFTQWEKFAIDPTGTHTILAYQSRGSFGLLYNTYPDKLLNLGIIPQSLHDMQNDWYPKISQIFGVQLDSRHTYTKSDWEMWTAATCAPEARRLFVNSLAHWLNNTSTNLAFWDLFKTVGTGGYPVGGPTFIARPVAGGHYSLLAMLKTGQNSQIGTAPGGFIQNSTQALTESRADYLDISAASVSLQTTKSALISAPTSGLFNVSIHTRAVQ